MSSRLPKAQRDPVRLKHISRIVVALLIALLPLTLVAQQAAAPQAPAKQAAPQTWADKILNQESYATPPPVRRSEQAARPNRAYGPPVAPRAEPWNCPKAAS